MPRRKLLICVVAMGLLAWPLAAEAARVKRVRLGTHAKFSRVVFELTGPFKFRVARLSGGRVRVVFPGSRITARVRGLFDKRIRRVTRVRSNAVVLRLLTTKRFKIRRFTMRRPRRLVVDVFFGPRPKTKKKVKDKGRKKKTRKKPAGRAGPKKKWVSLDRVTLLSRRGLSRLALSLGGPALYKVSRRRRLVVVTLLGVTLGKGLNLHRLRDRQVVAVSGERFKRGVRVRIALSKNAFKVDRFWIKADNRLVLDVVKRGLTVTRPAAGGKPNKVTLRPRGGVALTMASVPGLAPRFNSVVGLALAETVEPPKKPGPRTARPGRAGRPGQIPRLPGRTGVSAVDTAKSLMVRGRAFMKRGWYSSAYRVYNNVRLRFPGSPLVEDATFGRADAFWSMHKRSRNLPLLYRQIAEHFQEAIDRFPKSDKVPWALLTLGRINIATDDHHRALGYFDLVIKDHSKSRYAPLAFIGRAEIMLSRGEIKKAVEEYQRLISLYPKSDAIEDAYWGMGRALFKMGRYEYSRSIFMTMLKRWPGVYLTKPRLLYYVGESYFRLRRYKNARDYLYWILNIQPGLAFNNIILARIGDTYKFEKKLDTARQVYRRVMTLYPHSDGAIIARIRLAEMDGRGVKVAKVYQDIIKRYPDREIAQLAQLRLGVWYRDQGQYDLALKTLKSIMERYPKSVFKEPISIALHDTLDKKALKLAQERQYRRLLSFLNDYRSQMAPNRRRTYLNLAANAYLELGRFEEAFGRYRRLYLFGDLSSDVIMGLIRSTLGLGRDKPALGYVAEFLRRFQTDPRSAELAYRRAYILERLGRKKEAAQALGEALKKYKNYPGRALALARRGMLLKALGACKEAIEPLKRAAELLGRQAEKDSLGLTRLFLIYSDLGGCHFDLGQYDLGIKAIKKALEVETDGSTRWRLTYRMIEGYLKLKQTDQAIKLLKRMAKSKDKFWATIARQRLETRRLFKAVQGLGVTPK